MGRKGEEMPENRIPTVIIYVSGPLKRPTMGPEAAEKKKAAKKNIVFVFTPVQRRPG